MRMKLLSLIAGAGCVLAAATMPAAAHHSFAAEFDGQVSVEVTGTVKEFRWVNPHSWLHVNAEKVVVTDRRTGKVETLETTAEWAVEGGAPSALLRRGWTRDTLPPGTRVTVRGSRSKDGKTRMNASDITFPDGKRLCAGSSNAEDSCE